MKDKSALTPQRLVLPIRKHAIHHLAPLLVLLLVASSTPGETLIVTNLADSGPGTLREAIGVATNTDIIEIHATGTLTLNSELVISNDLFIGGQGADLLKVSGNHSTRLFHFIAHDTLPTILSGMTLCDGRVAGTNGAPGMQGENVEGGGIRVGPGGNLWIVDCVVSNNTVVGGEGGAQDGPGGTSGFGGYGYGGGIANSGILLAERCHFVDNTAMGGDGGPVTDGSTGIGGAGRGGGLHTSSSSTVRRTTLDSNRAIAGAGPGLPGSASGGGIFNSSSFGVQASTIVSNAVVGGGNLDSGGGIANADEIIDSTIVGNSADRGGGITGGDLRNTIVAGNNAAVGPDAYGSITSSDFNLIQNTSGIFDISGDTNSNILGVDPLLGPLQDNGGEKTNMTTFTMAPLPGSPVVDQGFSTMEDQRGVHRPFSTELPKPTEGNRADIGAVEFNEDEIVVLNTDDSGFGSLRQALLAGVEEISFSSNVTGTITLTSGELVVNYPVEIQGPGADVLAISGNQNGRIFNVIADDTSIVRLTLRDGLVVGAIGGPGQPGSNAEGGAILSQGDNLELEVCVIASNRVVGGMGGPATSGSAGNGGQGRGGGIYNEGEDMSIVYCRFEGNQCVGGDGGNATTNSAGIAGNALGGAVYNVGEEMVLAFSGIINNQAAGGQGGVATEGGFQGFGGQAYGGGLYNESTAQLLFNSISGGSAVGGSGIGGNGAGDGAGIYNLGELSVLTCTIASNSGSGSTFDSGGGILNIGTLNFTNCTVAGNQADFGGGLSGNAGMANTILAGNNADGFGSDASGTVTSFDYNLIQDTNGLNLMGATANVILGQDPLLGTLKDNGGLKPFNDGRSLTLTMSPLAGSPVIDQGIGHTNFVYGLADQRAADRPVDLTAIANAAGGDGSDMGAFELGVPPLEIFSDPPNVVLHWSGAYGDVTLEGTTNAPPTTGWITVTNLRTTPGGEDDYHVSDSTEEGIKVYRLSAP